MTTFFSRLEARVRRTRSLLCVGLDPYLADLTSPTADAARDFCLRLIDATADVAAAYKPNSAFFEALGPAGWAVLGEVIAAVPDDIPVILDVKRGDIASTAEAYARSVFDVLDADAITLNPYLGHDSIMPFLHDPRRGVFLLCKTSNPGSRDLQDLPLAGRRPAQLLYEKVAELAQGWNRSNNLGLVVGATDPEALARIRRAAPNLWILAPGVGAQGGDLVSSLRAGLRADGMGLLIAVSRGIARAANPRAAAQQIVQSIRREWLTLPVRPVPASPVPADLTASLAEGLLAAGCVQFGQFTLKSGLQSPIYIDLRRLIAYPGLLGDVAEAYAAILQNLAFDRLAAVPYAALPIATAISLQTGWPMLYPRKESKSYGTQAEIEGVFMAGERVVVIDDLATTGGSKFEAIQKLSKAGLVVEDVVVLIDRQSGAREALTRAGFRMHAVVTLTELLDHWERAERVPCEQINATRAFLAGYQEPLPEGTRFPLPLEMTPDFALTSS